MGELKTDWVSRHKLTVDDYHRLGSAGILAEGDRVELVGGDLIDMAPIGSRHAGLINKIVRLLSGIDDDVAILAIQNPVRLSLETEPQPDVALLRPRVDFYTDKHPEPADILLVIEVADASLRYDREIKVPLYARYGIPEYWIVDIENRQVVVYCDPVNGDYGRVMNLDATAKITPEFLPTVVFNVAALF